LNKRASGHVPFFWNWAEMFFMVLLIAGLILGIFSPSAVITYLMAFFTGFMAGRLMYERKHNLKAPYMLIVIGFIIGYVLGTFYGSKIITLILFIGGYIVSYQLYDKKIVKDVYL